MTTTIGGFKSRAIETRSKVEPTTAQYVGRFRQGHDVVAQVYWEDVATDTTEAGSTTYVIVATAHSANIGDLIEITSGTYNRVKCFVQDVSTNSITLSQTFPTALGAGITFTICAPAIPKVNSSGLSNVNVVAWGGTATSLGQKANAASVPVTLSSDQTKTGITGQVIMVGSLDFDFLTPSELLSTNGYLFTTDQSNTNGSSIYGYHGNVGGIVDDVGSGTVSENAKGMVRITPQRAFHVNLRNQSGTEISPATETTLTSAVTALQIMDDWDESDRCKSTIIHGTPSQSGGSSDAYYASLTSTGTTSLSSARKIMGWVFGNGSTTNMGFIKIYDKASAATNSDTPILKLALGPGAAANVEFEYGIPVSNGISIRATTAVADSSTASPTANDVFGTILYV